MKTLLAICWWQLWKKIMSQYDSLGHEIRGNATVVSRYQPQMVECDSDYQPAPAPIFIEPQAPQPNDYDIAPCDEIAELQRQALPILKRLNASVQTAESELLSLEASKPVEHINLARRFVETGVFHSDKQGKKLVYTIVSNGDHHMKHLMTNGDLTPENYRMVDILKSGTATSRIIMLHNDIKQLSDVYKHPDLSELVESILQRKIDYALRLLVEKRQELQDFKLATKKRLQHLEKRFKSLLDA